MKKMDMEEHTYYCLVGEKKYCYRIPHLRFNENGKTYSGVAPVWEANSPQNSFDVPFYTKYDEVDLTTQKIESSIRKYVEKKSTSRR